MPHNWASAECVRYLRHSLAVEDGRDLRLLAGISDPELAGSEPLQIRSSPTRFGRLDLTLEPLTRNSGWRLKYKRASGPAPSNLILPARLGRQFQFSAITGTGSRTEGGRVLVETGASSWEAVWKI
jgi:hypothetical protein